MNKYTDTQVDILLDYYFRDDPRPAPFPAIARAMGCAVDGLDVLLWKVITGYGANTATGKRRVYVATAARVGRVGKTWLPREDAALRSALAGDGRLRTPPVDTAYIAAVLARDWAEVDLRWRELSTGDPLGRKGFGL